MKYNHLTEKEIVKKIWLEIPLLKDYPFCNKKVWPLLRDNLVIHVFYNLG